MKLATKRLNQKGFTLVELMIATLVFSVVLLLCMAALLQVSKHFYKGVSSTRTQETARSVMTTISESIQFSGGAIEPSLIPVISPEGAYVGFCVDHFRFSYIKNRTFTGSGDQGLVMEDLGSAGCSATLAAWEPATPANGRELLQPNMRVQNIRIKNISGDLWEVKVDLATAPEDNFLSPGGRCLSDKGTQFCATTSLSTIVQKRVQ